MEEKVGLEGGGIGGHSNQATIILKGPGKIHLPTGGFHSEKKGGGQNKAGKKRRRRRLQENLN